MRNDINLILLFAFLLVQLMHLAYTIFVSKNKFQSADTAISLGILGTFSGVAIGLLNFNPDDIKSSIPELLTGLKLAFFTSITGMVISLLLKGTSKSSETTSDYPDRVIELLKEISENKNDTGLNQIVSTIKRGLLNEEDNPRLLDLSKKINESNAKLGELSSKFDGLSESIAKLSSEAMVEALKQAINEFNDNLVNHLGDNFKQLNEGIGKILEWQNNYRDSLNEIQSVLSRTTESLNNSSEHLSSIVEGLSPIPETVEKIESLFSSTDRSIGLLYSNLEAFSTMKDNAVNAMPEIENNIRNLTEEFSSTIRDSYKRMEESSKDLQDTLEVINEKNVEFSENINKQIQATIENSSSLLVKTISDHTSTLNQTISSAHSQIDNTIRESGNKLNNNLDSMSQQMEQLINQTVGSLDKALQEELEKSISIMGSHLASLSTKLVNDYTPLTDRLSTLIKLAENIQRK